MDGEPAFENLPNFRQAGGRGLKNRLGRRIKDGLLFRSSRTDFVTMRDKGLFRRLGIKSIVDLRRQSEYERSDGEKLLDDMYQLSVLKKGRPETMIPSMRWGKRAKDEPRTYFGRRFLVDMTKGLIWHVFGQLNFLIPLSLILVVIDWVFGSYLFVKLCAWLVLNHMSVSKQYMEVLERTKPVIVELMRFLAQEENLPALIHCAHGKDRTGLIVLLVLGCLEVEEELIVEDYSKSEVCLGY